MPLILIFLYYLGYFQDNDFDSENKATKEATKFAQPK